MIALQRTGDPGKLSALRDHLDLLSSLDPNPETTSSDWKLLNEALEASEKVVFGLLAFMSQHSTRRGGGNGGGGASGTISAPATSDRMAGVPGGGSTPGDGVNTTGSR